MDDKKEQWDNFISENKGSFLQSWQWGEFQKSLGRKIWRIENNNLKGLIIKYDLPLNKNYLYCPYGPIGQEGFNDFLEEVKKISNQEKSIFLKIELQSSNLKSQVENSGFIKSSKQIQPAKTIILDLRKSEEDLLSQMHPKTRYNIRLAKKKGITIKEEDIGKINIFLELLKKTAKRDNFQLHPEDYYRKMVDVLGGERIKMFSANCNSKVIAANLVYFFNEKATYLHGSSDYAYRKLMAPYLLQWQVILEAKNNGFSYYDFWGIDEKKWPGVTRFKKGFNKKETTYPGPFDLVFKNIYYKAYNLARKVL